MKLGTIPNGTRDGELVVVSQDLSSAVSAKAIAPNLLTAMENWAAVEPKLTALAGELAAGRAKDAFAFDQAKALSPLPRSFQWIDGSCFKNHLRLMALATGRDPKLEMDSPYPLMYQGMSDDFYRPQGEISLPREEDQSDFEGEVGVVLSEVPMGTKAADAHKYIRLILLINDVSCRAFVKREITVGFGWMHAKPSTAFSPVAVTPDELGHAFDGAKVNLPLLSFINGRPFGRPVAGDDMTFDFPTLIAHAAKTRPLSAGTILGAGTVSNRDADGGPGRPIEEGGLGYSCLAEQRTVETIRAGKPATPFLKFGDRVRIEMKDANGASIFGAIEQKVERYEV
ncbi:MAG: fumarylacetoacetate hydrolase family protein [Rhodoferax sp.]|nr:fumarylacetoacetate hydrolase family protein [Rhodoferax sp.]